MARRRGGYQPPSKQQPPGGPGAMSNRTDGPVQMARTGLPYGENKAVNEQQSAAPIAAQPNTPTPGQPQQRRALPAGPEGIFGGTERPDEPLTAGIDWGAGPGAQQPVLDDDPNMMLRALAQAFPHPDLERFLARLARG